jgi:hypothetical protein
MYYAYRYYVLHEAMVSSVFLSSITKHNYKGFNGLRRHGSLGQASHCLDIKLAVFNHNSFPVIHILFVIMAILIFRQGISTVKSDQHCKRLLHS